MKLDQGVLEKHKTALQAAFNYYVYNLPTGILDRDYDAMERAAREDGLELRDYVLSQVQGTRVENADYIHKIPKEQVPGDMYEALVAFLGEHPEVEWIIPKYDGSSLAGYYDPRTGRCIRVVTIGGSNLGALGIDQTKKFQRYFPDLPGTGICAVQAECLVSLEHGFGEASRQKANGLVNSKFLEDEVELFTNIRAFRYFLDPDFVDSATTLRRGYHDTLCGLPIRRNQAGDIKFSGGFILNRRDVTEANRDLLNHDIWRTDTGTFLVDGIVCYTGAGVCVKALKYKDAGRGETAEVLGIKWNNQAIRGKDSWSGNAIITPVVVRGSKITKPSIGSVKKVVTAGISKGARVTIILANSTIPMVDEVMTPGDRDYEWPTCSCGYRMSEKDIYGSLLKCGNPECTERLGRMRAYLSGITDPASVDLDKLLVIDRFKWEGKVNPSDLLSSLTGGWEATRDLLKGCLSTDLQKRNLELVIRPAWRALTEWYEQNKQNNNWCYR